jgi:hypothetical protein
MTFQAVDGTPLPRRPPRGVVPLLLEHHPHRAIADFKGVLGSYRFRHDDPTLSDDGLRGGLPRHGATPDRTFRRAGGTHCRRI